MFATINQRSGKIEIYSNECFGQTMMARLKSCVLVIIICSAFPGCTFFEDSSGSFELEVFMSANSGTIVESYFDGDLESENKVTISFNFSKTTVDLRLIGVDKNDGSDPIEEPTDEELILDVEFQNHGNYSVSVYAVSLDGFRESFTTKITIDLQINWVENSTSNPIPLELNPIPKNGGEHPTMIDIESEIFNPSILNDFSGGRSVQFSWTITDELGDTCQRMEGEVSDGESELWQTLYFNTFLLHELGVSYEDGQDLIDVHHEVLITYNSE